MPKAATVSIIVPVYNVAGYVGRCFDSIAAQTYPHLECIFVDDCGTDASMEIVRERIATYQGSISFKIVRHEKNRGLSAARNTGVDAATGEYVYFLDSDDLITPDCIALLAEPLRERRIDFVLGNYTSGGDKAVFIPIKESDGFIVGNEEIRSRYLRGGWFMMAWNRLVNREFFLGEHLYFEEGLLHEDNLWSFQLACCAHSMCVVKVPTYVYTIRGNSITTAKSRKNLDALIRIADLIEKFVRERNLGDKPDVLRFIVSWREILALNARAYGFRVAWDVYRAAVRSRPFSAVAFRSLGFAGRLKYVHHLLPAPLGFAYLLCTSKTVALGTFLLRRFKQK